MTRRFFLPFSFLSWKKTLLGVERWGGGGVGLDWRWLCPSVVLWWLVGWREGRGVCRVIPQADRGLSDIDRQAGRKRNMLA